MEPHSAATTARRVRFDDPIRSTTPEDELTTMLAGHNATIMAGGHTHLQMVRRYANMLLINPGSVGLPFERTADGIRNPPWAEFAIITVGEEGNVAVELRRVAYEIEPLIDAAVASGMPHADWWTNDWR